jgi:hypothetical protein
MSPRATGPSRVRARVLVPAIGVPLAVAAAIIVPMQATAAVDLPDKSPEQLIEFAAASEVDAFSGTIEQQTELGLPDLSAITGGAGGAGGGMGGGEGGDAGDETAAAGFDQLLALATGSWQARVYLDGDRGRLQVLDRLAERNVYVSPDEAWFVDSETATATRLVLPTDAEVQQLHDDVEATFPEAERGDHATAADELPTPEQLLDQALARLDETTEVSVGPDGRVAGRDAYELILEPRTDETLVGEVRFAIDGETGAPLSASVTARGADEPAYSIGFSEVSFSAPEASALTFEPGADITVAEHTFSLPTADDLLAWKTEAQARQAAGDAVGGTDGLPEPVVHGEGWASVVEMPVPADAAAGAEGAEGGAVEGGDAASGAPEASTLLEGLAAITQPVDGGRALSTSLVSVLLTDDGRVLAGSVPVERLVELAAGAR